MKIKQKFNKINFLNIIDFLYEYSGLIVLIGIIIFIIVNLIIHNFIGNQSLIDTKYRFHTAIIKLPNDEIIEGEIKNWKDYSNSDQMQVTFEDGTTYLVHSNNAALMY